MPESNSNSKQRIRTVKFCPRCAKPMGNQGVSSLTGWLFQETFCQCQLKESSGRSKSADTPVGSLFGDMPGEKDVFDLPDFGSEYEVLERIGKGGMGCVYKVRDVNLDRFLAVKVLHDELKDDQQSVSRFEREAKAALKLMHENLVPVFAYGSSAAGAPYLVMDFVDGISLETKLKNETYLEVSSALGIFIQICGALTHAHQHGIIHRDIKPGNIIITKESSGQEVAKLVDFGIAKVRSGSSRETQNLTQAGEVFGSPHYMSPEQCLGFDLDSRSDIYSLGCVMYECLSGKTPFDGHNSVQLIAKHLSADQPPLRICDISQGEKVNNRLQQIISKCLEKEPGDRYLSVELLAGDLKSLTQDFSLSANDFLNFSRKLSVFRTLFVISSASSLLSIAFVLVPERLPWLILLPVSSAILGAVLINERLKDFVSRTQFQSKAIRDSAGECVSVLVLCHWILAACAVSPLVIPAFHFTFLAYPIFSAALGCVVMIVVWAGFLQSIDSLDIKNSISSGKIMQLLSLALLVTVSVFVAQTYRELPSVVPEVSQKLPTTNSGYKGIVLDFDEATVRHETPRPIPAGVWDDGSQNFISSKEYRKGVGYRIFKIPSGVNLGSFYTMREGMNKSIAARGEVTFPLSDKIGLRMSPAAFEKFAPLLNRFAEDDITALGIISTSPNLVTHNADDVMYFISTWKKLQHLNLLHSELSDYGLSKARGFSELTFLNACHTRATAEGICALPQLRRIQFLHVDSIWNARRIIKALKRSDKLFSLSVAHTNVSNEDLQELRYFPNLYDLNVSHSKSVSDEGIKYLCHSNSKLQFLNLNNCAVTSKVFPSFAKLKNLTKLELSARDFTDLEKASLYKLMSSAVPKCRIDFSGFPAN